MKDIVKMRYLNKFSKFFKKKEKIPFDMVLINLQKFIDSVCPEEISKFKTTRRVSKEFKIIVNDISVEDNRHPEYRIPKSLGLGRIKILLSQDSENYILITLCYNDQMKFDMLTWSDSVSISGNMISGLVIEEISPTGLRVSSGSLFDRIRDYLEENNLIGEVDF